MRRLAALLPGTIDGTRIAALDHQFRGLHVEPRLGGGLVVAGDAILLQEGVDLAVEIELRSRGHAGARDDPETGDDGKESFHFFGSVLATAGSAFGFTVMRIGVETWISTRSVGAAALVTAARCFSASALAASAAFCFSAAALEAASAWAFPSGGA